MRDTFSKRWDDNHGFTYQEALQKKANVEEAYGVGSPNSKWEEAKIVPDPKKKDGYMVTIDTKKES